MFEFEFATKTNILIEKKVMNTPVLNNFKFILLILKCDLQKKKNSYDCYANGFFRNTLNLKSMYVKNLRTSFYNLIMYSG